MRNVFASYLGVMISGPVDGVSGGTCVFWLL